jgi:hypothetical protein
MSGELKATVEWTPTDPVAKKPRRRRREKRLPTTRGGVILHGLRRLVLVLAALSGAVAGGALLYIYLTDSSASSVFPLAFYLSGAAVGAGGLLRGLGTYNEWYWDRPEREQAFNTSFVYAALGAVLFGLGLALDYLL